LARLIAKKKGATKSNKGKKMHGVRDFCPVLASFVRAGHEPLKPQYCHLNGDIFEFVAQFA
jgi:hypothetical protein